MITLEKFDTRAAARVAAREGSWFGQGLVALGIAEGTAASQVQLRNLFGEGRHPDAHRLEREALASGKSAGQARDAGKLGRKFLSASNRKPVSGFELICAPVKSVSILAALGSPEVVREVEAAHFSAVEQAVRWFESEALFTRRGSGGKTQIPGNGMIACLSTRSHMEDLVPHLHTRVAVSNKVQAADGVWLAVDGRVVYQANVTVSELYNSLLEAELIARLGVRFADRCKGEGATRKRPVREVVGIDAGLRTAWSPRQSAIEAICRQAEESFYVDHGRQPNEAETRRILRSAARRAHGKALSAGSEAELRASWRAAAAEIMGGSDRIDAMIDGCMGHKPAAPRITKQWVDSTAETVIERIGQSRMSWDIWDIQAEVLRQFRAAGVGRGDLMGAFPVVVRASLER